MQRLTVSDGASIAYADEGAGAPLLLLHGWGAHASFFDEARAALSPRMRVVTPDLRGHRHSIDAPERNSIERLARDVAELIEALDLSRVVIVGWSMGAMVMWRALAGQVRGVAGVVSVDMSPKVANDSDWRLGMRGGHNRAALERLVSTMRADWPGYCRHFAQRLIAEGSDASASPLLERIERAARVNDPDQLAPLWLSLVQQDARALLPNMSTPSLIVHGAKSQLYSEECATTLQRLCGGARRIAYERSGHAPHLEEPARFAADIENFAAAVIDRGKSAPH